MNTQPRTIQTTSARRTRRWVLAGAALVVAGTGLAVYGQVQPWDTTTGSVPGVREIVVDIGAGPVTLPAAPGSEVGIRTVPHGLLPAGAGHRLEGGVLTVFAGCFALNCYTEQHIAVPAGIPVRVHTGVGDVTATDLDVPRFDARAGASSVTASFVRPPDDVRIDAGTAGNVELRVPDAGYRVDVDSAVGTERVDVAEDPSATRSLSVRAAVGSITVTRR